MVNSTRYYFIFLLFCGIIFVIESQATTPSPITMQLSTVSSTLNQTTDLSETTTKEPDEFPEPRPYYKNQWSVDSPPNKNKPYLIVLLLILAFTWTVFFSLAANLVSWYAFFFVYVHSYRNMWSIEEKLRIATKKLESRHFGDDLMAKIQKMTPYDANQNDQEISTMLKSVNYNPSKPVPQ